MQEVQGIKNCNDPSIRYDQTENSFESFTLKLLSRYNVNAGNLVSCGASTCACLAEGMGWLKPEDYPQINGKSIQFDDYIMAYMNDPRNWFTTDPLVFDNEIIKNYVKLIKDLFNKEAMYRRDLNFENVAANLCIGQGVQLCMIDPGHFVAAIAYDHSDNSIIYLDSRKLPGTIYKKFYPADFDNIMSYGIVYLKEEGEYEV